MVLIWIWRDLSGEVTRTRTVSRKPFLRWT
jgi:hypothetical protein